jgi:hypothetical protein
MDVFSANCQEIPPAGCTKPVNPTDEAAERQPVFYYLSLLCHYHASTIEENEKKCQLIMPTVAQDAVDYIRQWRRIFILKIC